MPFARTSLKSACVLAACWMLFSGYAHAADVAPNDSNVPVPEPVIDGALDAGPPQSPLISPASAAFVASPVAVPDSLPAVLDEVWSHHPRLQAARAELAASGFDVSAARAGYWPYLQMQVAQGEQGRSAATAALIVPLWDGGLTGAQVDEARLKQAAAEAQIRQIQLDLALEVIAAYTAQLSALEREILWTQYIEELRDLQALVQRRSDQGVAAASETRLTVARLRLAEAGRATDQAQLDVARSQLESLLQRAVRAPLWPSRSTVVNPAQLELALDGGLPVNHPQRVFAQLEWRAQQARVRAAKASLWPRITLQHAQQLEQLDGDFTPANSTQLVLQYQTDSSLRAYRGSLSEAQRVEAAKATLAQVERELRERIRRLQISRNTAEQRRLAQEAAAAASSDLADSYLRQFKAGRRAWLDLLNVQREAHEARRLASVAKRDYWQSNSELALQAMVWGQLLKSPLSSEDPS